MSEAAATILVIDDDPTSLELALRHLSAYDYAVLTARDGERGFRRALHVRPDLVLLDLGLPGIDGHEVCRRLKAHPTTQGIPVVFLTARAATDDKLRSFELQGVDYLVKPFSAAELVARVRVHLTHARRVQALEQERAALGVQLAETRGQLSAALVQRAEDQAERSGLLAVVEVQRRQLADHLERLLSPDPSARPQPRFDTVERVRLALGALEAAQAQAGSGPLSDAVDQVEALLGPVLGQAPAATGAPAASLQEPFAGLSAREREVFELLVTGCSNKQIAARLGVSSSTVSTYRARVMEKLGAHDLAALVRIGLLRGR